MSFMETILNVQEGLSFVDGDKDLYKILLDTYVEENKFDPDTFKALIQKKDFEAAAKAVHKTKGASYQIGAKTIRLSLYVFCVKFSNPRTTKVIIGSI